MATPYVFIRDVLPQRHQPTVTHNHSLPLALLSLSLCATVPLAHALQQQVTEMRSAAVPPLDAAVGAAVLAAGLLVALWYAATGIGLLLSLVLRRELGVAQWGAPFVRRLAAGASLGLLAITPAHADTPDDMSWGTVVALDPAELTSPNPRSEAALPIAATATVATHVVEPGESLWRIAQAELREPTDRAVAARVLEWLAANPELRANPDLIHPGDELVTPDGAER